jgi:hypothetical protein
VRRRVQLGIGALGFLAAAGSFVLVATSHQLVRPWAYGFEIALVVLGAVGVGLYWAVRRCLRARKTPSRERGGPRGTRSRSASRRIGGSARRGPRRSSPGRARHLSRPSPRRWPSTCARRGRWAWDPACAARRRGRRPLQQRDRGSGVLLLPRGAPERRQARRGGVEARIFIRERPDRLEFEIRDEGQGFRHRVGAAEGRGLTNMQERLAALGGTLEVESAPGGGTRVRGGVPLGADR